MSGYSDSASSSDIDVSSLTSPALDTAPATNVPVGLMDPRHSQQRRQMLALINRLRGTGAQLDLDLPVIGVLGSQSAGKSSLIESISGIKLPRASGTCTRCPTECLLTHSDEPWRCVVSLRLITDARGAPLAQPKTVEFGEVMTDKADVADRIRRAQLAILNPSVDAQHYTSSSDDTEDREISFSSNSVCLHITGKDVDDLSFVDLPGLIVGGNDIDRQLVQTLAESYIGKPSCIILLTIACETDFENQSAHKLAERYDPNGSRTIGVLTKPDRIPEGEEDLWIRLLNPEASDRHLDFYCVKNPSSQALKEGITWKQARSAERLFFSETVPWATLDWLYNQRLGTDKLTHRLAKTLTDLITRRLPELQNELEKLLTATEASISRLPAPPSDDYVAEILGLVGSFSRQVERHTEGFPSEDGLLQQLRPAKNEFKKAIRRSAPDFRPCNRPRNSVFSFEWTGAGSPHFLIAEEGDKEDEPQDDSKAIYMDEVLERANSSVTRELPCNYPFVVKKQLIGDFIQNWTAPSHTLFLQSYHVLRAHILSIIETHLAQYTLLKQRVVSIVSEHMRVKAEETKQRIRDLQRMEQEPFTLNERYFVDYREKFLSHYRSLRRKEDSVFLTNLGDQAMQSDAFKTALSVVMAHIPNLGFRDVTQRDLLRLQAPDSSEDALEIMADVRAYFQIAFKRFVDNVPMTIDLLLIKAVEVDLQKVLLQGLGVKGPEGFERCRQLLEEPEEISGRREELVKRRERLARAREELVNVFVSA